MLAYQIKNAIRSMKRNPALSVLLIAGIGLGIAVSTAFITTYYLMAGDPIPDKSDQLFYVEMDSWNPERPYDDNHPDRPPVQVTYRDAMGIMESEIPTHQSVMFKASLTVQPAAENEKPYREEVRMCFNDFFVMFDVPFLYGGSWSDEADTQAQQVAVITAETNRKLFGGEDSVGRNLRIENESFTVIGVVGEWRPPVKFYDPNNFPFEEPEAIFLPFNLVVPLEIDSAGNDSNWKYYEGDEFSDWLQSESVWLQMWVQLDDRQQRDEYQAFLDAYAMEQKKIGRFQRPVNNLLLDVMSTMRQFEVVPDEAKALLLISIMFLVVCSVNLIGILLGKFLSRAPEIGVRRALGASRRSVFLQHIVECEVIGVLGGVLGIGLSVIALDLINRIFDNQFAFYLDFNMVMAALLLSLVAGLIAGIYPSWRICRVAPASYLKEQ
jgi:putative ABC transport system permease protein